MRFSLSYRNVEELLTERGLPADHTTIWRWVQCYAPELNKRCRRELKPTNRSWTVDETYECRCPRQSRLWNGFTAPFWDSLQRSDYRVGLRPVPSRASVADGQVVPEQWIYSAAGPANEAARSALETNLGEPGLS